MRKGSLLRVPSPLVPKSSRRCTSTAPSRRLLKCLRTPHPWQFTLAHPTDLYAAPRYPITVHMRNHTSPLVASKSDNDTTKNHQQVDGKKSVPGSPKRMCFVWRTLGYWLSLLYQLVFHLSFGFLYLTILSSFCVFSISLQTHPHVLYPILMLSIILDT